MAEDSLMPEVPERNEDYTGACCLLFWTEDKKDTTTFRQALRIDADDIPWY